jgi:cephalosporin hydroxylase
MSKLKEMDDEWIVRRLERWGKRDGMPFMGPEKTAILQQLVSEHQPRTIVEVGTMAGYSAIKLAQAAPAGAAPPDASACRVQMVKAALGDRRSNVGSLGVDPPIASQSLMTDMSWVIFLSSLLLCSSVDKQSLHLLEERRQGFVTLQRGTLHQCRTCFAPVQDRR